MKKTTTIILGSGFSKIADFPTARELSKILEDNILSHPIVKEGSGEYRIRFSSKGITDYNRVFQSLIKQFEKEFQFEMFLEWLYANPKSAIASLDKQIFEKQGVEFSLIPNLFLNKINEILTELVFQILARNIKEDSIMLYSAFVETICELLEGGYKINIFTLNYDLLLEKILDYHGLRYDDGFSNEDSPVYFRDGRIARYDFRYNSFINIHKLHGSIDYFNIQYRLSAPGSNGVSLRNTIDLFEHNFMKCKIRGYFEKHQAQFRSYKLNPDSYLPNMDVNCRIVMGGNKESQLREDYVYYDQLRRLHASYIFSDLAIIFGYSYSDPHVNKAIHIYGYNKEMSIINVNPHLKYSQDFKTEFLKVKDVNDQSSLLEEVKTFTGNIPTVI